MKRAFERENKKIEVESLANKKILFLFDTPKNYLILQLDSCELLNVGFSLHSFCAFFFVL
jgi:hypothetical protein